MTARPWRDRARVERLARAGRLALEQCLGHLGAVRRPRRGMERWDVPIRAALAERERPGHADAVLAWGRAEALWWRLALTADRVAEIEARRHASGLATTGLGVDDLHAAGRLGAYRAAQGWNPDGGSGWPSYVGFGVQTEIRRTLRDQRPIGAADQSRRRDLMKALGDLERRGLPAHVPWAAEWLELDADLARELLGTAMEVHLDARIGDDGDGRIADLLGDDPWDPTDRLEQERRDATVRRCLEQLDARGRLVLEQRSQGLSLREVGEMLTLSPERIRQIEQRARVQVRELLLAAGLGQEEAACPS